MKVCKYEKHTYIFKYEKQQWLTPEYACKYAGIKKGNS